MSIVALGIDLAKNVFALHGVDETGKVVLRKPSVKREKLLEELASLPPCLIGMEACSGAHDWARKLKAMGHDARMMAPKLVAPYRDGGKRKKNDAVDAEAICEAVQRKKMRFVPLKSEEQQSRLAVHTARDGYVAQRTATINRIRGLLTKVGDPYLRKLLVMGARAVLNAAEGKSDRMSTWALQVRERRGYGKALVAIAAKNARIAWAMLSKGQDFRQAFKEA